MEHDGFTVATPKCVRCGACSTLAPALFSLRDGPAVLLRQPGTGSERDLAMAALLICPSHAIGVAKEQS